MSKIDVQSTRSSPRLKIWHFDDEPERICHLGQQFSLWFALNFPGEAQGVYDVKETEDRVIGSFGVLKGGDLAKVEYEVFGVREDFAREYKPEPHDIAIVDLMIASSDGQVLAGIEILETATAKIPAERVFLLTGYPEALSKTRKLIEIPSDNVMLKPPDTIAFTDQVGRFIGAWLSG